MGNQAIRRASSYLSLGIGTLAVLFALPAASGNESSNVIYHLFVRSFCDSDEAAPAMSRGDLDGITSRLDSYLNDGNDATNHDLGVGLLWLMPIFPSDSYHGYNVRNYVDINPDYGTLVDFDELIAAAKARGVRIILDLPINHTSNNHPWFLKAVSGDEEMKKRYFFREGNQPLTPGWHSTTQDNSSLQYFGLFDTSMPDLNFDDPSVRNDVRAIAKFWLDRGVAGFRLDAAKHVYGDTFGPLAEAQTANNNLWWLEFSNYCYSIRPDAILMGEVLGQEGEMRSHTLGLEGLLDAQFMHGVREHVELPTAGFVGRVKSQLEKARQINDTAAHAPNRPFEYYPFIGSHDENPRLASKLDKLKADGGLLASVDEAYRLALYMLLTMGDKPVLYNGEELMQRGWKWDGSGDGSRIYDETLREPFPWYKSGEGPGQTRWFAPRYDGPDDGVSVEEQNGAEGMLSLVRGLIGYRTKHQALTDGEFGEILSDTEDWMVFERIGGDDSLLVMINPTAVGKDYLFHDGWFPQYANALVQFWSDGQQKLWQDDSNAGSSIAGKVFVPPYGLVLLKKP